jgi:hypothetical protein
MSAAVIPSQVLEAKRKERERLRQEREAWAGSILGLFDEDDQPCAPASGARERETQR